MHRDHPQFPDGDRDWKALGLVPIGIVRDGEDDWQALAIDGKRRLFSLGAEADEAVLLDREALGPLVYESLDETCHSLWGHSWNSSIGEIFRLNRRTTQRDRVASYLLPPRVLQIIAYVASADDREELAGMLLSIARYAARFPNEKLVHRYVANALEIFFGDFDEHMGIEASQKGEPTS
ncbi:hypothetical protein G3T14_15360 [Methylobacterium sp. BTF04]|uniref:hypothetical protein n=1 Tax=Methylobacterium sp. BTF04 TaxID=2708300 RepID=UPI0013D13057|nr:hypothetical protein [Methylobacterium sp. BTF04]NEU13499.1 hypothetical protein [Methylobacterium sp. BTF04]